jgi:magnesium-transporting ATPase (P-type)
MKHPELYEIGLKNTEFSTFVFWESFIVGLIQSTLLLIITFETMDGQAGYTFDSMGRTDDEGMRPINGSLFLNGMFIYQAIVVIVNVKIFIHSSNHTWLSLFFQLGSILVFYLGYAILSTTALD